MLKKTNRFFFKDRCFYKTLEKSMTFFKAKIWRPKIVTKVFFLF